MLNKLKMKLAARRMQRQAEYAAIQKNVIARESLFMNIISWPFRMIGHAFRWFFDCALAILSWMWDIIVWGLSAFWAWLCGINLVGLINLALLVAIIVLCTGLILNIVRGNKKPVVVNTTANAVSVVATTQSASPAVVAKPTHEIPVPERRNVQSKKPAPCKTTTPSMFGDVIIESRAERVMLQPGAHIRGNLYLQRMRKYVLPCNVVIEGNLFLRDVGLLEFCGPFTVTGNIYVSPKSSFGPLPYNSRLGGQVIL